MWSPSYASHIWVPNLQIWYEWYKENAYPPETRFQILYMAVPDTTRTRVVGSVTTGWIDAQLTKRDILGYTDDGSFYELQNGPGALVTPYVVSDALNIDPEFSAIWPELMFFEPLSQDLKLYDFSQNVKPYDLILGGQPVSKPNIDWSAPKTSNLGSKVFEGMLILSRFMSCRLVLAWPWGTAACGAGLGLNGVAHWLYFHRQGYPNTPPSQGTGWVPGYGSGGGASGGATSSPSGSEVPILGTCSNDSDCPPGYACIGGNCLWIGGAGPQIDWGEDH
jgi:hypothetical protein